MKKIMNLMRRKWLKDTFLTAILVVFLIGIFIAVNLYINKLDISPLDFTEEKLNTLSDESKEQVKNINQDVHIYFFGYDESNPCVILAKQYHNANDKISAEAIDITARPDLAQKYHIDDNSSVGIIVESTERYKVLRSSDFVTYDTTTYETIDITEQTLTNAIINTTIARKPHIYFLTGHGEATTELSTLNVFIQNEINDVSSIDLLQAGDIPEDCDCLVIASPTKDFEELEANKILDFINRGGNILWLEDPTIIDVDFPNVNKILGNFGFNFSKGMIAEQDSSKILLKNPFLIIPNISYHEITKDLYTDAGVVFAGAGKINFQDDDKLNELGLNVSTLLTSSEQSVYIEDYSANSVSESNGEVGSFTLGAEIIKKIDDNTNSKMVVYSNCNFITDTTVSDTTQIRLVNLYNNKDLILNSLAYLTDREDSIRIRKDSGMVVYAATLMQDRIVKLIIFIVPIIIIVFGIVIWQIRRRKK